MAESTLAQEAREFAKRIPAGDARFKKIADLLKRYVAEEAKYAKAIDAWPDAAGGIEVASVWLTTQAGNVKALQPFVKRADAFADVAAIVADHAEATLKGASAGKFKSFAADFQTFCDAIEKVNADVAKDFRKRLVDYATAEREAVDAAKRWRVRIDQIAAEGKVLVAALAKETDRELVQLRKFVEARFVNVPKERAAALADIGG